MSSGGAAAGGGVSGRVSIPNNVRKTIQNIKEITGNHSEEDIYAMLKECSMDPNETADKLLLQGYGHSLFSLCHDLKFTSDLYWVNFFVSLLGLLVMLLIVSCYGITFAMLLVIGKGFIS